RGEEGGQRSKCGGGDGAPQHSREGERARGRGAAKSRRAWGCGRAAFTRGRARARSRSSEVKAGVGTWPRSIHPKPSAREVEEQRSQSGRGDVAPQHSPEAERERGR